MSDTVAAVKQEQEVIHDGEDKEKKIVRWSAFDSFFLKKCTDCYETDNNKRN